MANNENANDGPSKDESTLPGRRRSRGGGEDLLSLLDEARHHYEAVVESQQQQQQADDRGGSSSAYEEIILQRRGRLSMQPNDARILLERVERLQRSYHLLQGGQEALSSSMLRTSSTHQQQREQESTRGLQQSSRVSPSTTTEWGELLEILQQALDISSPSEK